ncbi:MAG: outer membrane beta-barrel protein [Polyangiaceae bacterium]|nr:outer membrane beta-barrel protein [Polyangiaceae bacterium]MCL4755476.1 outer membrane beta-barrel protein [Myxococcales bacterium]
MRTGIALALTSAFVLTPALAAAQDDPNCPPGGWFCEETDPPAPPPDEEGEGPPPGARPLPYRPPVMVYEPEPYRPPPPAKKRRWTRKWGLNLHLQGVMMGGSENRHDDSGMAGLGFGFRYRPIPHFAFEAGLDFLGGVDWQGNDRRETALLLNAMVFVNPRDAVQFYMLGGFGFSGATVTPRDQYGDPMDDYQQHYSYFGGQLGAGLEFRITRRVSLNVDMIGFVRGRTDEDARLYPEFTDPETGRTTNSSGGGLFRGGITFYW